jgi:hypothetical protein
MATPDKDRWPYPRLWCPVCKRGCATLEDLVCHQLVRRHWRPLLPPANLVDPAAAQRLRQAIEAAEARRQQEVRDGLS